ncbi:MAG: sulfotransferase family protein [Cyanobacteria bacterium J06560_6]
MGKKVFCIGSPKTGTTSLGSALKILGYNHKSYSFELSRKVYQSGDYKILFAVVEEFDSFDDGPWNRDEFYKVLDENFPGSQFILTVRETQSWSKSHENHFSSNGLRNIRKELWINNYDKKREEFIQEYEARTKEVINYFSKRPKQLLVMNICESEGWEKLCPFLNLPIPSEPFPTKNVTANKKKSGRFAASKKKLGKVWSKLNSLV